MIDGRIPANLDGMTRSGHYAEISWRVGRTSGLELQQVRFRVANEFVLDTVLLVGIDGLDVVGAARLSTRLHLNCVNCRRFQVVQLNVVVFEFNPF